MLVLLGEMVSFPALRRMRERGKPTAGSRSADREVDFDIGLGTELARFDGYLDLIQLYTCNIILLKYFIDICFGILQRK
jgi:hypothetical protein